MDEGVLQMINREDMSNKSKRDSILEQYVKLVETIPFESSDGVEFHTEEIGKSVTSMI